MSSVNHGDIPFIVVSSDEGVQKLCTTSKPGETMKLQRRSMDEGVLTPTVERKKRFFSDFARKVDMKLLRAIDSPLLRTKWRKQSQSFSEKELTVSSNRKISITRRLLRKSTSLSDNLSELPQNYDHFVKLVFSFVTSNDIESLIELLDSCTNNNNNNNNGNKFDINYVCRNGTYPIHEACYKGHIETIDLLFKHGARVDKIDSDSWTPLHAAVFGKKPQSVQVLIKNKADVNARDVNGWTPLHIAIYQGDLLSAACLLSTNASCLIPNSNGLTAFQMAIDLQEEEILHYLFSLPELQCQKLKDQNISVV